MAQRPLVWSLGIAFAVGFVAMGYGTRLADFVAERDEPGSVAIASGNAGSATSSDAARPAESTTLTVSADYRGQYLVHPTIENFRIRMLVDTGASLVALTEADARNLGIRPAPGDYKIPLRTANGIVRGARVNLREVRLGGIIVRNVEAVVLPAGALSLSLLGTSFLSKLRGYEVQSGRMILRG